MVTYLRTLLAFAFVSLTAWSCQLPTQPTADTVPVKLQVKVRDQGGNALPNSRLRLERDSTREIATPEAADQAASTWKYSLSVPISGERYTAIADPPPPVELTTYRPSLDSIRFTMPCRDTTIAFVFDRRDSIPCGNVDLEQTLDLGTICADHDTSVVLMTSDIIHDCPAGATISSITAPIINGLSIDALFRQPDQPVSTPGAWAANRPLAVRVSFSSAQHNTVDFDGNDIVVDASPNVKLTIHLKGRAVSCDSCNCPNYDTISFGLATIAGQTFDTNEVSLLDNTKSTTVDLSRIGNSSKCDLLFTRTKDFSNDQLRAVSLNGSSNVTTATLGQGDNLGSLLVDFSPKRTGEVTDTTRYRIQKRDKSGTITNCDTLTIIYHGHVGQGMCQIDTASTNASAYSYLRNDTITNCLNADDDYRYLCIKNIGDGTLHTKLPFAVNDTRFFIRNEATGNRYQGEDVVIPKGGRFCFSIHFIPSALGPLASNSFTACETLPIYGRVKNPCINCLDGGLRQYQVTPTSFQGFEADSNAFLFVSDQNAKLAIYAVNVTAANVDFQTMTGTTFSLVRSNYTLSSPLITLCDDQSAIGLGKAACSGIGSPTISAGVHDLILFSPVPGKCGLLYIDNIHNSNGILVVDFQATYPIN